MSEPEDGLPSKALWRIYQCALQRADEHVSQWENGLPLLPAERTESGGLRAWCPYCKTWHYHSALPGHRVAHCYIPTPYTRTGYILTIQEAERVDCLARA